jgi:hypothetical protein
MDLSARSYGRQSGHVFYINVGSGMVRDFVIRSLVCTREGLWFLPSPKFLYQLWRANAGTPTSEGCMGLLGAVIACLRSPIFTL